MSISSALKSTVSALTGFAGNTARVLAGLSVPGKNASDTQSQYTETLSSSTKILGSIFEHLQKVRAQELENRLNQEESNKINFDAEDKFAKELIKALSVRRKKLKAPVAPPSKPSPTTPSAPVAPASSAKPPVTTPSKPTAPSSSTKPSPTTTGAPVSPPSSTKPTAPTTSTPVAPPSSKKPPTTEAIKPVEQAKPKVEPPKVEPAPVAAPKPKVEPAPTPVTPAPVAAPKPILPKPSTSTTTAAAGATAGAAAGLSLASLVDNPTGKNITDINPEFAKRMKNAAAAFKEETGKKLYITSGYRSNDEQKIEYDKALTKFGGDAAKARKYAAEPMPPLGKGKGSSHLHGLAMDVNSLGDAAIGRVAGKTVKTGDIVSFNSTGWLEKFGLYRPMSYEPWHIQLMGSAPKPDAPLGVAKIPGDNGVSVDPQDGSTINSLSQENTDLKKDLKQAGSIITNNITENSNDETTRVVSYNKPSDTPPHITKGQGAQEETNDTNDKSAYANKVS